MEVAPARPTDALSSARGAPTSATEAGRSNPAGSARRGRLLLWTGGAVVVGLLGAAAAGSFRTSVASCPGARRLAHQNPASIGHAEGIAGELMKEAMDDNRDFESKDAIKRIIEEFQDKMQERVEDCFLDRKVIVKLVTDAYAHQIFLRNRIHINDEQLTLEQGRNILKEATRLRKLIKSSVEWAAQGQTGQDSSRFGEDLFFNTILTEYQVWRAAVQRERKANTPSEAAKWNEFDKKLEGRLQDAFGEMCQQVNTGRPCTEVKGMSEQVAWMGQFMKPAAARKVQEHKELHQYMRAHELKDLENAKKMK